MLICEQAAPFRDLDLPRELADLDGLLHADLRAIVGMVAQRAHERLCLTRREFQQLQYTLWNGLVEVVNQVVEPLSSENR